MHLYTTAQRKTHVTLDHNICHALTSWENGEDGVFSLITATRYRLDFQSS